MDIIKQLEALNAKDWKFLFSEMEQMEKKSISTRDNNLLYRYLGEIDDPEEMLYDFATNNDLQKCHGMKLNWFICSDGSFFFCGDCATDALFDSGKVVDNEFSFEIERLKKYNRLSYNEKIAFRIALQGITKEQAEKIVNHEEIEDWWD